MNLWQPAFEHPNTRHEPEPYHGKRLVSGCRCENNFTCRLCLEAFALREPEKKDEP